jgi:hypothetical protein
MAFSSKETMMDSIFLGGASVPLLLMPHSHKMAATTFDRFGVTSPKKKNSKERSERGCDSQRKKRTLARCAPVVT